MSMTATGGLATAQARQREELARMVAFARTNSPLYAELYRDLPDQVIDVTRLPVTSKASLMPRFDDWVTDRTISSAEVKAFISDPALIGRRFRGQFKAATTSGSTGNPGIFLLDRHYDRAVGRWMSGVLRSWLDLPDLFKLIGQGGRMATIAATGAHFVVATTTTAINRSPFGKGVRLFGAETPLPELVAQLNNFRPAILAGYAGIVAMLAREQEAGRLKIRPALVMPGSEALPLGEETRIAKAFGSKVGMTYVATECLGIASSCRKGWLHLNSNFAIVEPVDADYRPTPPGEQSHTVLITNLANRIQPILRYDLSDSLWVRPDPCECGNPLPAVRVQGRTSDLLRFATASGDDVAIAPLVLQTAIDRLPSVERFQIVQERPAALRIRITARAGHPTDEVWSAVERSVAGVLSANGVVNVQIIRAPEPPEHVPGRKFRSVVPLS
jgi:phenylacetate-coenzyme A ligase PaaK-like adenylate-forming protein